jgi:hypothetical protein
VEKAIRALPKEALQELDKFLRSVPTPIWTPLPGPQTLAYRSKADEVFFGGAAGGGKSFLGLGLALTAHRRSLILRRESVQLGELVEQVRRLVGRRGSWRSNGPYGGILRLDGRVIEFNGCERENDKYNYQGRAYDLYVFDEASHFSRTQVQFIIGWNRTDDPNQRCRVLLTGNPPTTPEGRWVVEDFAPWLDAQFHRPAAPGELRWYTVLDGKLTWLESSDPVLHRGERIVPRSRTFYPARLQDNPIYMRTGYLARLQAMPEPLRSQLLYGDMTAGMQDDPWQVIPTAWVRAAQERWRPDGRPPTGLSCLGVDVARGGADKTVMAERHGPWYAHLHKASGSDTPDGPAVTRMIVRTVQEARRRHHNLNPRVNIDVIGVGASVYDECRRHYRQDVPYVKAVDFRERVGQRDRAGVLTFKNLRAYAYWSFREALDPEHGDNLALPPDSELLADLTAARWQPTPDGVKIESKEEIAKRLGRSPDCADAVVLAHLELGPIVIPTPTVIPLRTHHANR